MVNKRRVSKVIGAGVVTVAVGFGVKKLFGSKATTGIVSGLIGLMTHEALDAPVSTWAYKNI
jgi:hypothetical protein